MPLQPTRYVDYCLHTFGGFSRIQQSTRKQPLGSYFHVPQRNLTTVPATLVSGPNSHSTLSSPRARILFKVFGWHGRLSAAVSRAVCCSGDGDDFLPVAAALLNTGTCYPSHHTWPPAAAVVRRRREGPGGPGRDTCWGAACSPAQTEAHARLCSLRWPWSGTTDGRPPGPCRRAARAWVPGLRRGRIGRRTAVCWFV